MNNENEILELISPENYAIYKVTKKNFNFKGYDYWHLLQKVRIGKILNENILTKQDEFEYLKCYVNAVVTVIGKKYKGLSDKSFRGRFQVDYLHELIPMLRKYYDEKPYPRFFKKKQFPPKNEKEDASMRNWITRKAGQLLSTMHSDWVEESFARDGIDYEGYRQACIKTDRERAKGKFNTPDVDIDKFRSEGFYKEYKKETQELIENTEDTRQNFDNIFEEPINVDGLITEGTDLSIDENSIESLLDHFKMNDEKRMRKFINLIAGNKINDIEEEEIWKVQIYNVEVIKIWLVFFFLDKGSFLTHKGKQFLLMQYFIIAVAVLKNFEDFETKEKASAFLSNKQMTLICSVISKTYIHFFNDYKSTIFKKVPEKPGKKEIQQQNKILEVIIAFIKTEMNAKLYKSEKDRLKKEEQSYSLMDLNDVSLHDLFADNESFSVFINNLKFIMTPELRKTQKSKLKGKYKEYQNVAQYFQDSKIDFTTIYFYLNPYSQYKKSQIDYDYIIKGCISAVTVQMISDYLEDEGVIVTLADESNINWDFIIKASAELIREIIDNDFDIKRGELPALTKSLNERNAFLLEDNLKIGIPNTKDFQSFRTMIELNGEIKVKAPVVQLTGEPYWTHEYNEDIIQQLIEKSLLEDINSLSLSEIMSMIFSKYAEGL